ncbi:hypothetical protein B7463_g3347, partial [Scytalidium lignicola]
MIGIGLNWWQSIIAIFIAQSISVITAAFNSRCSESYHIGFPIVARSVFGIYGAFYAVGARAMLAAIYYSLKIYVGSSFVVNMLQAVFGSSFTNIPNHVPASVGFTTQQFLAFFLYWLIHIPLVFLRLNQLKWLFTLKMAVMLPTMIGLFIFCMVNTKAQLGTGKLSSAAPSTNIAWLIFYGINTALGAHSTLVTNQPDYSRWAAKRWASIWPQLLFYPISVTVSAVLGILSTAAINNVWGLKLWNQWDLLTAILVRYPQSSARFAVFLCALCWAILVIGTNIAANSIPFGADCALLAPRYLNQTRGQLLGLLLAWVICPWYIYASAATFTKFLSGYGLFMAGLTGIMVVDYYFISRGNLFLHHLYDNKRDNPHYRFYSGVNIQAYIAYICGCALGFPGFLGSLGVSVPIAAQELGYLGWLLSFSVSALLYIAMCSVWPTQNQLAVRRLALKWEEKAFESDEDYQFAAAPTIMGTDVEGQHGGEYTGIVVMETVQPKSG